MDATAAKAGASSWSKTMFNLETIRNGAIAALFSIILTATAVGAAPR